MDPVDKHLLDLYHNGELLVFDYAPNLKIVGTYHGAKSKHHIKVLEELIDESDFVALEYDKYRLEKGDIHIKADRNKRGYSEEEHVFYVSNFDKIYLSLYVKGTEMRRRLGTWAYNYLYWDKSL
ncbi:unnamed protein product, partial [marine sediment metagenome]